MGRPILIREDRGDSSNLGRGVGGAAGARVFVGNLSWQVAWQDLKDHMRQVSFRLKSKSGYVLLHLSSPKMPPQNFRTKVPFKTPVRELALVGLIRLLTQIFISMCSCIDFPPASKQSVIIMGKIFRARVLFPHKFCSANIWLLALYVKRKTFVNWRFS